KLSIGSGSGPATEQFAAIGQLDRATICDGASGLGAKTCDFNLCSRLDGVYLPAEPDQSIRRSELETPIDHIAIRFFNVDVYPCMLVCELNLRYGSVHFHRLVHIEFGSESVMRRHRLRRQNQNQSRTGNGKRKLHMHRMNLQIIYRVGGVPK